MRGGQPVVVGARGRAAAGRRARAVADGGTTSTIARRSSRRSAACSSGSAAVRGASGSSSPIPSRRCRSCSSRRCRARAGPRSADSLAGAEDRAVSDRGSAGHATCPAPSPRDGQEFIVSLARRDVVEEYEGLVRGGRRVRGHRRSGDVQRDQRRHRRAGAAPAGDWLLVNVASDYASIAILRGADLIFFRNRGGEGEGTLADLVHQTAMYYEDRLTGAGFARVILGGGGQPDTDAPAPQPRSVLHDRRAVDPRRGARRPHLGGAEAARHARAARRPARCANGRRPRDSHEPLHAAVLQRARRQSGARCWSPSSPIAATIFNVTRFAQLTNRDSGLVAQIARDEARATDLRTQAARLRATIDPKQIELVTNEARKANDLIDRRTFSWTELFNRFETTLPDDVRITSVRPKVDTVKGTTLTITVVAKTVEDVVPVHGEPRGDGRVLGPACRGRSLQRSGASSRRSSTTKYSARRRRPRRRRAGAGRPAVKK